MTVKVPLIGSPSNCLLTSTLKEKFALIHWLIHDVRYKIFNRGYFYFFSASSILKCTDPISR